MTTQTAAQINIILPANAQADWTNSVGYAKGENVVANDGVAQAVATVIAKISAQHGPVVVLDHASSDHGPLVARISRMWCGGGDEFVYADTSVKQEGAPKLMAERTRLTTELANCEPGALPGTAAARAESAAIKALAAFDAAHPEVLASVRAHGVAPQSEHND